MASIWEQLGEAAGYAIGAAIFGPTAAIARRERRVLRLAFHGWLDELDAERLPPRAKGMSRRSGSLRGAEPIPFEAELDPFEKRGRVDVALTLGKDVRALISKELPQDDLRTKIQRGPPFATAGLVRIDETNLDEDAATDVASETVESAIGRLDRFTIDLRKDRVVLDVVAPREVASWITMEKALVVLVESWSRRWTTYR